MSLNPSPRFLYLIILIIVCITVLLILADVIITNETNKKEGTTFNSAESCLTEEVVKCFKVPQACATAENMTT